MAPRDHVEVYFRALVPDGYQHVAVGPFGAGAFLRATATGIEPLAAQWGMIAPARRHGGRHPAPS